MAVSIITPYVTQDQGNNKVNKNGDTMTDVLSIEKDNGSGVEMLRFGTSSQQNQADILRSGTITGNAVGFRHYSLDGNGYEDFYLPTTDGDATGHSTFGILTDKTPVTVEQGGTGVTSLTALVQALGLTSALKYKGALTSLPDATASSTYSAYNSGDVVSVGGKEYVYVKGATAAASSWNELGDEGSYVLKTTTVNGKALSGNITLNASDVNAVPTTRKINGKPLDSDITITIDDVSSGVSVDDNVTLTADYLVVGNGENKIKSAANAHINTISGTTASVGREELILGNSIAEGTENNLRGQLTLYAKETYTHVVKTPDSGTDANRIHTLPNHTGWLVSAAAGGVGGAETAPIYITNNGVATAITKVDIAHGGTGATTAADARTNLGITPANIGAISKSGDTMTGVLSIAMSQNPYIALRTTEDGTALTSMIHEISNNRLVFRERRDGNNHYESYKLPVVDDARTTDVAYDILTSKTPVTIAQGGTGATTATEARTALGITPANIDAVAKTGDTMTGALTGFDYFALGQSSAAAQGDYVVANPGTVSDVRDNRAGILRFKHSSHRWELIQVKDDNTHMDVYQFPATTTTETTNSNYNILTTKNTVTVAQGGTGATTLTSGRALIGNGTEAVQTRAITNLTSDGTVTANTNLITANTLVYYTNNRLGNYLPLTGGTLTGGLTVNSDNGVTISQHNSSFRGVSIRQATQTSTSRTYFYQFKDNNSNYDLFRLPSTATTEASNTTYDILTTKNTITVAQGGTGAATLISGEVLIGNGTGAITTRAITNNTATGDLGWASSIGSTLITLGTIAYWNGRYSSSKSNLQYCKLGEFGSMAIASADDYVLKAGDTMTDSLTIQKSSYPAVRLRKDANTAAIIFTHNTNNNKSGFWVYNLNNNNYYEAYYLPIADATKSVAYNIVTTKPGEEFVYASGDTFATSDRAAFAVILTESAKKARFTVIVDKSLDSINTITVTRLIGGLRGENGYIGGSSDSFNWLTATGVTVSAAKISSYMITVTMTSSTAYAQAVSNHPAVLFANITFTFS